MTWRFHPQPNHALRAGRVIVFRLEPGERGNELGASPASDSFVCVVATVSHFHFFFLKGRPQNLSFRCWASCLWRNEDRAFSATFWQNQWTNIGFVLVSPVGFWHTRAQLELPAPPQWKALIIRAQKDKGLVTLQHLPGKVLESLHFKKLYPWSVLWSSCILVDSYPQRLYTFTAKKTLGLGLVINKLGWFHRCRHSKFHCHARRESFDERSLRESFPLRSKVQLCNCQQWQELHCSILEKSAEDKNNAVILPFFLDKRVYDKKLMFGKVVLDWLHEKQWTGMIN